MITTKIITFDVMSKAKSSAEIRKEFGGWMKLKREKKGLSQKHVAEKIGLTETQLSRIENGKSGTTRDTVIAWASEVGVDENEALRHFKPENLGKIPEIIFSALSKAKYLEEPDFQIIAGVIEVLERQKIPQDAGIRSGISDTQEYFVDNEGTAHPYYEEEPIEPEEE